MKEARLKTFIWITTIIDEAGDVFIPAMAARLRSDERAILLWDEYISPEGHRGFLLAADDHSKAGDPSLYNFLRSQQQDKARQEVVRLLYVGTTRAISSLTLTATLEAEGEEDLRAPVANSLLAPLWAHFEASMVLHRELSHMPPVGEAGEAGLRRVVSVPDALTITPVSPTSGANIPERPSNLFERSVGTVVHKALERLASSARLVNSTDDDDAAAWAIALRQLGLTGEAVDRGVGEVTYHIGQVLADDQFGAWLLNADHAESACELALTWVDAGGTIRDSIIDRTFVDALTGVRWIVDYKTSRPLPGENQEAFENREAAHYGEQLADYAAAMSALDKRPIQCALYFTAISSLVEVAV